MSSSPTRTVQAVLLPLPLGYDSRTETSVPVSKRAPPPVTRRPAGHVAVAPLASPAATVLVVVATTRLAAPVPVPVPPAPGGPGGPAGPRCPRSCERALRLMSLSRIVRSLMSDDVTAPVRGCLDPTLLRGSTVCAKAVPPSAITSARSATAIDGDVGARRPKILTVTPP